MLIKRCDREESLEDELVLIPWIELESLSVVNNPTLVEEDRRLRQELLRPKKIENKAEISEQLRTKDQVIELLKKHQIDVVIDDKENLSILGGLAVLKPPYYQCETSNVIVLDRISAILKLGL